MHVDGDEVAHPLSGGTVLGDGELAGAASVTATSAKRVPLGNGGQGSVSDPACCL